MEESVVMFKRNVVDFSRLGIVISVKITKLENLINH